MTAHDLKKLNINNMENDEPTPKKTRNQKGRCTRCQKKLSLVDITIGQCKCGDIFCRTHIRPSQHLCLFDHLQENQTILAEQMVQIKPSKVELI